MLENLISVDFIIIIIILVNHVAELLYKYVIVKVICFRICGCWSEGRNQLLFQIL